MIDKGTAVFMPVRLKSRRLKNKALKKIGNESSISWCIKNCLKFNGAEHIILLTSTLKEDLPLTKLKFTKKVKIFKGHPVNLFKRFLDAAKKFKVKTIIRVTGDCPFVSSEIINFLFKEHRNKQADFTAARKCAVGTSAEIIEVSALNKMYKYIKSYNYSEYMKIFFTDNPKYFKNNIVKLPKKLVRNYRLTLDYLEDLKMFNRLYIEIKKRKIKFNIFNIFKILDRNKLIRQINDKKELLYVSRAFKKQIAKFTKIKKAIAYN